MTLPAGSASRVDERCAIWARSRGDSVLATALPVERFILIEVPGPWVTGFWDAADLPPDVATHLRDAAIGNHARLLLIRRPGRHPEADPGEVRRWAVVTRDGVAWGTWRTAEELLKVDVGHEVSRLRTPAPVAEVDGAAVGGAAAPAQRPLALVCTHGRKDMCCAIEGRPVAAALVADSRVDVWECSHVGGDRFAANVLWLPTGLMFGGLTSSSVGEVVDAALQGRVDLDHYRGRCGDPVAAQAAVHLVLEHVGDDRPDSVEIESLAIPGPTDPVTLVAVHEGARYELVLEPFWTEPHQLTCKARKLARMRSYRLLSLHDL